MGEEHIWRSVSMEGKWKVGKGDVAVRRVDYYGKTWVDLRIMNVQDGKNQHTRHGVRLTVEQVKEMLPRLVEFCAAYDDEKESEERQNAAAAAADCVSKERQDSSTRHDSVSDSDSNHI